LKRQACLVQPRAVSVKGQTAVASAPLGTARTLQL
jgi:hypothetical protein